MRTLVAGGHGYVGSRLANALSSLGYETALLVRSAQTGDRPLTFVYDGTSASISTCVAAFKPDVVANCAADLSKQATPESLDLLLEANVRLPGQLAQVGADQGIPRLINISTYSTSTNGWQYRPQTLYAATKKAAEDILTYYHQSTQVRVCTLCFYDVYGPEHHGGRFLRQVIDSMPVGPVVMSPGEQEICFLHIDDAVSAIAYTIQKKHLFCPDRANTFTVHGDEVFRLREVPGIVAEVMNVECPPINAQLAYRPNEIMLFSPPYPRLPGWVPQTSFREGLSQILESSRPQSHAVR